jgi:hypothetical protein
VKMRNVILACATSCWIAFASMSSGCATRVILVPNGEPVRLAEDVKVRVWVLDSKGQSVRSSNRVVLPVGWYALPKD